MSIERLTEKIKQYLPPDKVTLVEDAYEFALKSHEGQLRISGEAYIEHPLQVALTLADLQLDASSIAAALLHDVPENLQREVIIDDVNVESDVVRKVKADTSNASHIAATMPGTVLKVAVSVGAKVKRGQHLIITEAMKMETTIQAPFDGVIKEIYVTAGESISTGDLLIELQ